MSTDGLQENYQKCNTHALEKAVFFYKDISGNSIKDFCKHLGISYRLICLWRQGKRNMPIKYSFAIEQLTGMKVKRKELFPDFPWG